MKPNLVIVGLGNHGKQYAQTRHNLGYRALDVLAEHFGTGEWKQNSKFQSRVCEARIVTTAVLLVKPETYMNLSGDAVRKIVDFYKLDPSRQLLCIVDDVDLPLGELRFRREGGPGTHNGMKSLVEAVSEKFPRLRIGIGTQPPGEDLATWVLSIPPPDELALLLTVLDSVPEKVRSIVLSESQNEE